MKSKLLLSILAIFLLSITSAGATPHVWTDSIDWDPNINVRDATYWNGLNERHDSLNYQHSIADDGFKSFWVGGDDTISSFSLKVSLLDDENDICHTFESARVITWFNSDRYDFSLESNTFGASIGGYIDLMLDGTLNVRIEPTRGDFLADWSMLTVWGDDGDVGVAPVPEPATMLLLGIGLVGLAGVSRKTKALRD